MNDQAITMPRPPEDITPEAFFKQWLPSTLDSFRDLIREQAKDLTTPFLAVRVTGEQGGEWSVVLNQGEVEIKEGLDPGTAVTFVLPTQNFIEFVTGQRDEVMMQPPGGGMAGGASLTPEEVNKQFRKNMEALRGIKGQMQFIADDPDRPFNVHIKFQGELKDQADAVLTVATEDLRQMSKGELSPPQAFMMGKVKVKGDMGLIMQLAPLFS